MTTTSTKQSSTYIYISRIFDNMNNQQAVVDQIVQNLAFDVEAVPKSKSNQASCISQSTPLNVKIKVRKKEEIQTHDDVPWIANNNSKTVQKVRLVNSDRTIMTFDVFMEAEFEKKPSRKLHKHFFDMLKPGICLGAVDDDKCPYMPSSSYSANITEPTKATKSDGTFKQTFTLSKNVYQDYSVSTQQEGPKWLFGKCKPGGCLDPPFSEDKYSYKPSTRSGLEREEEELLEEKNIGSDVSNSKNPIILQDEETQSNERHSSIFDSGLFKKKRRSSDKSTNTKLPDKIDSIVDIYKGDSATNSASTRSNSIITYPPKTKSVSRMSNDKAARSREPSEDKPRKSFNEHSEPYFIPPKGVNRIKEKDSLDPSDYPRQKSTDVNKLKNPVEESFKIPVPLPIPIPVMVRMRKPELMDPDDDILTTQSDNAMQSDLPEQGPQKQKRRQSATGNFDDILVEFLKTESVIPSNIEQPASPDELNDKRMDETKLQPFEEIDSENQSKDTEIPKKKEEMESLKMPVSSVPVDSETNNQNLKTSDINITQSKTSFKTKTTPPIIKDKLSKDSKDSKDKLSKHSKDKLSKDSKDKLSKGSKDKLSKGSKDKLSKDSKDKLSKDSKDIQENIDPWNGSIKNESTSNAINKSPSSDIGADEIPKEFLRTRGDLSDPVSDTENQENYTETIEREKQDSKIEDITETNDKPTKQNDIKDENTAITIDKEDSSNVSEAPDTSTQPLKDGSKQDGRKDTQRISQSKLPILQKSLSLLSGSKTSTASAKDKRDTKRSGSPDSHLDKVRDKDTDLRSLLSGSKMSIASAKDKKVEKRSFTPDKNLDNIEDRHTDLNSPEDEKLTLLPSGLHEKDSGDGKLTEPLSDEEYVDEIIKPHTDSHIDSLTGGQARFPNEDDMNFIAAPVVIDNIKLSPKSTQTLIKLDSETKIHSGPVTIGHENDPSGIPFTTQIASIFKESGRDEETHSTVSRELIGTQSVIYDSDELIPSTSAPKHAERIPPSDNRVHTGLSSIQSTSTLKSAMKKDLISIDLGFHSYINDKNERILKTFDAANTPTRLPNDSVTVLKTQIRNSSNEIRIPVDSEHDMSIQIKKSNASQRVSISESRIVNDIDYNKVKKQRAPVLYSDAEMKTSETKVEDSKDGTLESDTTEGHLGDYFEQELVPLQLIIKKLRNEIDVLAAQQVVFKDKLFCSNNALFPQNKSNLPRLVHSTKKCYGCVRK